MKLKRAVVITSLVGLLAGNIMVVSAEIQSADYSGTVRKFTDYTTETLYKEVKDDDASNLVSYVEGNRKLCSWILNYLGNSPTNKVYYDSEGSYYMQFGEKNKGTGTTKLNISTQITNFTDTNTSGVWSPDYIQ